MKLDAVTLKWILHRNAYISSVLPHGRESNKSCYINHHRQQPMIILFPSTCSSSRSVVSQIAFTRCFRDESIISKCMSCSCCFSCKSCCMDKMRSAMSERSCFAFSCISYIITTNQPPVNPKEHH